MRRAVMMSLGLACYAVSASAQGAPAAPAGIKLSDVAGTWTTKSMVGPKDSVVITTVVSLTADGKGSTMRFPKGAPVALRLVAVGGDSTVTEAGPYPSALRPGQTVTLLHVVEHYKGDACSGWFEAHYSSGDVLKGKVAGTRQK